MVNRYMDGVKSAGKEAARVVSEATHEFIQTEHLLVGICKNKCTPLEKVSKKFNINLDKLQSQTHTILPSLYGSGYSYPDGAIHRSPECKEKVFLRAETLSGPAEISCLHLLAAILEKPGNIIKNVLQQMNVDPAKLQKCVLKYFNNSPCTNLECNELSPHPKPTFIGKTLYGIQKYSQDLTQTCSDKIEDFLLKLPHMLHAVVISIFILLFGAAEGYLVVIGLIEGKDISKLITHALIHTFLFSLIIYGGYIVYKRFITTK